MVVLESGPRSSPSPAPLALSSIGASSGSLAPRNFGAAFLPSPGAAGSFVDRRQFWELCAPKIRGRIPSQPRRRWLFRRSAPVLGVWYPGISGSHFPQAPAHLALSSICANSTSLSLRNPVPITYASKRIYLEKNILASKTAYRITKTYLSYTRPRKPLSGIRRHRAKYNGPIKPNRGVL